MKIKLKATNLSVGFIFVLTVLSGIASAETLVFEDNFDSYDPDTFPSSGGWNLKYDGYGSSYQVVDNSESLSSPNSLKLEAQYNWASASDHSLSETPEQITYEVDVKIDEPDSIEDEGRANAQISIVDPDVGWGKSYSSVVFGVNGLVGDSPYNYNQWYHVKINLDMEKRTFDAWVDDKQIVTNLSAPADGYYKAVRLCAENAGHTRVWFDNVKVTQGDSSPSDEAQKVQFRGNLENIIYTYSQNTAYVINVTEIIFDPGNSINVGDSVQVWHPYSKSSASVDIVEVGDYVEVHATGLKLINSDDFLKKIDVNKPPQIVSINANPAEVETGGSSTITVVANDPDGDTLTYSYESSGGEITGTGSDVTWTADVAAPGAPPITGTFVVNVIVSDGKESVTSTVEVTVVPKPVENKPPEIVSINANPAEVETGGSSTITVVANDPDGDTLTYSYEPSGGEITGTGNVVTWTADVAATGAPPITGAFIVYVTVSDGKEKVTSSVEVTVIPKPVENNPPEIVSINANPAEVEAGVSTTITVVANDPDGDTLTYSYEPGGGEITGTGNVVTWTADVAATGAPPITGTFIVYVTVSDGKEEVTSSVEVKVVPNPVEKYALIVGINEYDESRDLDSPINNANAIYNLLVNGYGYTPSSEKIRKLVGNDATRDNFWTNLIYFEQKVDSNDIFVLYFSGHGGLNDTTGDEYIVFPDESPLSSSYINSELKYYSGTVVAIFDCCHSGGMAYDTDIVGTKNGIDGDNRIVLMSCEANEEAFDLSWSRSTIIDWDHSFFTSYLISAFTTARNEIVTGSRDKVPIEGAFSYARDKTFDSTKYIPLPNSVQHPRIMDNYPTKSDNKALCYLAEYPINSEFLAALTDCPVHLHAYDSKGRHTGVTADGNGIEEEIPGSFYNGPSYDPEEIIVLGNPDNIRYEIKAFDKGVFNFTVTKSTEEEITKIKYENISITSNTTATLLVDYSNTKYVMQIDDNGDGIEDRTKEPDEITVNEGKNQESSNESSSDSSSSSSSSGGSGSSSSSSGGGGGTGGSPEPASNVEIKELSQQFITNGKHVKFLFPRNVTCITYVAFDPKKTAGKTTTIVEMLKRKSTLVPELPSGKVYENANIWVGNKGTASLENIENAVVGFRVEKSWLDSNGVDAASVRLWRFDSEKWGELSTSQTGKDEKYIYFEAATPGFSPFSITALSAEAGVSVNAGESSVARAAEDAGSTAEMSEESSEAEENISHSSEASTAEEAGSGIFGSMKRILLVAVLLSATVLLGFMALRKQG